MDKALVEASLNSPHSKASFLAASSQHRPKRCSLKGDIVQTGIAFIFLFLLADFNEVFTFFENGLRFQMRYLVLIFVARWSHNFREIAVKNLWKSTEALKIAQIAQHSRINS